MMAGLSPSGRRAGRSTTSPTVWFGSQASTQVAVEKMKVNSKYVRFRTFYFKR